MINTAKTPCIIVTCDDCGDDCWEDGVPHFESLDEARKYVGDDWLWTDTEHVCGPCHAKRECAFEGHDWSDWQASTRDDVEVYRLCNRCTAFDYTVAVSGDRS